MFSNFSEGWDVGTWLANHSTNDYVHELKQFCGNVEYCFRVSVRVSFCSFGGNGAIGKYAKSSLHMVFVFGAMCNYD